MPAWTRRAVSMGTAFLTADDSEATARRTGLVTRASKLTGTLLLALVTFGPWHAANTTLAPLAAQAAPWDTQVAVAPEAMHQRLPKQAMALLQAMIRQALAQTPTLAPVCEDGLLTCFPKVSSADRTGFALPEALHQPLPGAGGSAAKAGANRHAVWDSTSRVCGHCALTPWHMPEP
jgi:hypothetical protein